MTWFLKVAKMVRREDLAIQGTPLLAIAELMGHKTLSMTQRYAHLSPDMKRDATLALEESFEASRNGKKLIPITVAQQIPAESPTTI